MHILIEAKDGRSYIVKKSDIRRVYQDVHGDCFVLFNGAKNPIIPIRESVSDFFNKYLAK